jgi:hypothetical protein
MRESCWDTWPVEIKPSHVCESPAEVHDQLKKSQVMYARVRLRYMPVEKKPSHVCESSAGVHDQLKKSPVMYARARLGYITS